MKIINKTSDTIRYDTDSGNAGDCGTIAPGGSAYIPYTQPAQVRITPQGGYFTVNNVPASGDCTIATLVTD